ncbi:MAG: carboxypeptidase regulatory-like domain-containing protein [Planctomycetes bacterium]|nr:carboxypeptidase regulatory-like domain-containing protein [Planctomycetota bacterium]
MRSRWFLVLGLSAALAGGAIWLLRSRPGGGGPTGTSDSLSVELPVPDESAPKDTPQAATLELDEDTPAARAQGEAEPLDEGALEPSTGGEIVAEIDTGAAPVKLSGRLVDENTKLPLPEFELEFEVVGEGEGPRRKASAVTDAQGHFECAEPILVARCVVRFLDRKGHKRVPPPWTIEIEDVRKSVLELEVPWGPTYRVAFAPKDSIPAAQVELRLRSSGARKGQPVRTDWEPVHAGDPAWARFQPLLGGSGAVEKLEARTRDGLWVGEADAGTASGLAPGITLVTFEARAVLEGDVLGAEKEPLADVDVLLEAKDAEEHRVRRRARTRADGHFRFEELPACLGEVQVRSVRHQPWSRGVTLLAGQTQQLPVVLTPLPVAGSIRVRLESESGLYAPKCTLHLTLEDDLLAGENGARFARHVRAQWHEENGRKVADFHFPDLPRLAFHLAIEKDDYFTWDPLQWTVQPPSENSRILIRDGIPNASLAFRVKDAATGEALSKFQLTLEFPGQKTAPLTQAARSDHSFLEHLPLEHPLRWRVSLGDHAPAVGGMAAFQLIEKRDDGEWRVCELELRPGWGECYRFQDSRSRAALEGVEVLLDGVGVGKSDSQGRVVVRSGAQPGRIEYRSDALGIAPRSLRADRRTGCFANVRVDTGKGQKNNR